MKIKIFCDIADLSSIKKFNQKKNCKGFYNQSQLNEKSGCKRLRILFKTNIKDL